MSRWKVVGLASGYHFEETADLVANNFRRRFPRVTFRIAWRADLSNWVVESSSWAVPAVRQRPRPRR